MKIVLGTVIAMMLSVAAFSQPAEAACRWNGYGWQCWHHHHHHHHHWRHWHQGW